MNFWDKLRWAVDIVVLILAIILIAGLARSDVPKLTTPIKSSLSEQRKTKYVWYMAVDGRAIHCLGKPYRAVNWKLYVDKCDGRIGQTEIRE